MRRDFSLFLRSSNLALTKKLSSALLAEWCGAALHILQTLQRCMVIHKILCRQHSNRCFGVANEQRVVTDAQTDNDIHLRSDFIQQLRLRDRIAHCLLRGGSVDGAAVDVSHFAANAFYLKTVSAQNGVDLPCLLVKRIAKRQSQLVKAALLGEAHGLCQAAFTVILVAKRRFLCHQPIERLIVLLQPGIHLFALSGQRSFCSDIRHKTA